MPAGSPMHNGRVWQVAVHPRRPLLASCSADRTARLWTLPDLRPVATLDETHTRSVRSVAWKPHGPPSLALGSFDATTSVWQLEEPSWEFLAQLEGHENEIKRVAWSGDGRYLATCSRDKSVWIWEVDDANEDFECVAVLTDHQQDVKHVVWHPHEELLASTSYDDVARLWRRDDDEWVCVADLRGHDGTVWGADFDPAGAGGRDTYFSGDDGAEAAAQVLAPARLATCSADLTVRVWQRTGATGGTAADALPSTARWDPRVEDWEQQTVLPAAHTDTIYAVAWGKHGLASVGADGRLVAYTESEPGVWEVAAVVERAHGIYEVNTVAWAGDRLVTGGDDGEVRLWTKTGEAIAIEEAMDTDA